MTSRIVTLNKNKTPTTASRLRSRGVRNSLGFYLFSSLLRQQVCGAFIFQPLVASSINLNEDETNGPNYVR